ncbi:Phenylacetic acid catabolic protein [Paraburkholderia bannensis]|uniref:Phenylacetic acid catabolic protein n=1 Tax=Paraburkholderia bannensis TaxID=765414 RepID=UPI002AB773EB|nr:Phenylacetic acid catabolic protein [Paraburkholderia bannensis]
MNSTESKPTEFETGQLPRTETHLADVIDASQDSVRNRLIREMAQQAQTEVIGVQVMRAWIPRAPTLQHKSLLLARVQTMAAHALSLQGALARLGITGEQLLRQRLDGTARYLDIFNYPVLSWGDIGMIGWLGGTAELVRQAMLSRQGGESCARLMANIGQEKRFHHRQSFERVMNLALGTHAQRKMAQDALDRWWWPMLMAFGAPQSRPASHPTAFGETSGSNDMLRQKFIDETVPQVHFLQLKLPDDNLLLNDETGHYDIGQIDWDTFESITRRGGVCNRTRMDACSKTWHEGAWVRDAAAAYAARQATEMV